MKDKPEIRGKTIAYREQIVGEVKERNMLYRALGKIREIADERDISSTDKLWLIGRAAQAAIEKADSSVDVPGNDG